MRPRRAYRTVGTPRNPAPFEHFSAQAPELAGSMLEQLEPLLMQGPCAGFEHEGGAPSGFARTCS